MGSIITQRDRKKLSCDNVNYSQSHKQIQGFLDSQHNLSCATYQAATLAFAFCFLASCDAKPMRNPTGVWSSCPDVNCSFLESTGPFEGWPLASLFTPLVSPVSTASGVIPELIMLRSCVSGGKACTGTPCGRIKRPLATAFFLTSAAARAALSSTPLPRGRVSPIIAALRDLLAEAPELPDPPLAAAAWNACIKSGWACHSMSNNQWEI